MKRGKYRTRLLGIITFVKGIVLHEDILSLLSQLMSLFSDPASEMAEEVAGVCHVPKAKSPGRSIFSI
jgi:hypothetical protein